MKLLRQRYKHHTNNPEKTPTLACTVRRWPTGHITPFTNPAPIVTKAIGNGMERHVNRATTYFGRQTMTNKEDEIKQVKKKVTLCKRKEPR